MAKLYSLSNKDKVAAQNQWRILYPDRRLAPQSTIANQYYKLFRLGNVEDQVKTHTVIIFNQF